MTRLAAGFSIACAALSIADGLLLGYGGVTPRQIRVGAEALARALDR